MPHDVTKYCKCRHQRIYLDSTDWCSPNHQGGSRSVVTTNQLRGCWWWCKVSPTSAAQVWLINSTLLPSSASVGTNFDFFLWIEELKGVSTANIALYLYVPKKCAMLKRREVGCTNDTTVAIYSDEFINRWPFCQPPAPSAFRSSPWPPSDVHNVFGHLGVSKKEGVSFFALTHMSWC